VINQAIMASSINKPNGIGSLGTWDRDAAQTVYGSGPVCNAPAITTQPANQSISSGSTASLSVVASGSPTLTYQWYEGDFPSTTTPAPGAATGSTYTTPVLTTTKHYWVRVTNTCGTAVANSNTAIVTVTCGPPSATAPIASPTSVSAGQTSTLTENATGSGPLSYQWYSGGTPSTGTPIGSPSSNNFITVTVNATTQYSVKVTNVCGTSDSTTTTVTVAACVPPSITVGPVSQTISPGQTVFLSVSATGTQTLHYQWYQGTASSTANPVGLDSASFSATPGVTTNYWVRVTGQCGTPQDSNTAIVTVSSACNPPSVLSLSAQPTTISPGQSSSLGILVQGTTPISVQWFVGTSGNTSNPIAGATGFSVNVSPASTTSYWARLQNSCNGGTTVNSQTITVTVVACSPSSITTHPSSATIVPGGTTTLTVVAAGTTPISYQWFTGTSGNTGSPITGATNASVTVSPAVTTSYWVRVSNSCNTTGNNSTTAVVTVSGSCPSPTILGQPADTSAPIGTNGRLTVSVGGTTAPVHYQWYQGVKGDVSKKVGTDSAVFTTPTVSVTTSYWVRASVDCGSFADSNTAVVTATGTPRGRAVKFSRD